MRLGFILLVLYAGALFCMAMIFLIAVGYVTPDQSIMDMLPSMFRIQFFVQQNLFLVLSAAFVFFFAGFMFIRFVFSNAIDTAKTSKTRQKSAREMAQYQAKFQKRMAQRSVDKRR